MPTKKVRLLALLIVMGLGVSTPSLSVEKEAAVKEAAEKEAAESLELEKLERSELEASIDEARAQLDQAAERLGELSGKLYKLETVGSHGKRPMLGVLLGERSESGGIAVVGVTPGGGAAAAGLEAGDELISINHIDLTSAESVMGALREAMRDVAPGDAVSVGYQRDGSFDVANVTTQARGVFIMGMTGVPGVSDIDFEIEGLQALEALTEKFADMDFSESTAWVEEMAAEQLEKLDELGPIVRYWIRRAGSMHGGLWLEDVGSDLAQYFGVDQGVLVMATPEEAGELKGGDIILTVAGEEVPGVRDAYRALYESDQVVTVDVLRRGVRKSVEVDPSNLSGMGGGSRHVIRLHRESAEQNVIRDDSP